MFSRRNFALKYREEGRDEGLTEGIAIGKAEGLAEGKASTIIGLVKEGLISVEVAAAKLGITPEEVVKICSKSNL